MMLFINILLWSISHSCDQKHFPNPANLQLNGLKSRDVNSYEECLAACCDEQEFYCVVFQWCTQDGTCAGGASPCWIGDHINIKDVTTGWEGRSRPDYPTEEPTPSPSSDSNSSSFTFGWLFIIILVSSFVLYCIIGYIINGYKHNKNWRKVANNIPNYSFWKSFPKLIIVGCKVSYEWLLGKIGQHRNQDETNKLIEVEPTYQL
eukprot:176545_1